jgi:hypothetical protein
MGYWQKQDFSYNQDKWVDMEKRKAIDSGLDCWFKKFCLDMDRLSLLQFAQRMMETSPAMTNKDHRLLDKKSRYWDWPTTEINDPSVIDLMKSLQSRHQLPLITEKTSLALWEYGKDDQLIPHTDLDISLSATVIVSLVGGFETRRHREQDDAIIDRVTYGPGEYLILNNTKVRHSGVPLDPYRLAMVLFVDPRYDMTHFWRTDGSYL